MIRAHSFDVYDTLLVRTPARPLDLFHAAADRAVPPDADSRAVLVAEVARRRREAELRALRRLGVDAVGLDAIYAELDDLTALGVDPGALRQSELDEEVRPIRAGAGRMKAARAAGRRVLFLSDMYLPAAHVRAQLERFGLAGPDDPLYVSGELGVDKRRGGLFDHVVASERLQPEELVHTGDDPVTDTEVPAGRGIGVEPLTVGRLNRLESEMLSELAAPAPVRARIAGATRAARVGRADGDERDHLAAMAANVAGPLFASYVAWVLSAARAEGVERLYFVARDAQVLMRVADAIGGDGGPELRYLYGSRQAWLLAGARGFDRDSLGWVLAPDPGSPRAVLARLDVDAAEVAAELAEHGLDPDAPLHRGDRLERLWAVIAAIEPLIRERAAAARARAFAYFEQEGLMRPGRWALVDVGWRLTAQSALRRVLASGGAAEEVLGFYLAVSRKRAPLVGTGPFHAFLLEDDDPGTYRTDSWLWANVSLVEQVLAIADHGSCTGYHQDDGRVAPVLRELPQDLRRAGVCALVQETIVDCARELDRAGLLGEHVRDVLAAGLLAGRLAVERPRHDEAAALGWIPVTDDQNETRTRELAPPLRLADVWHRSRERLGFPVVHDFKTVSRWPQGSLALAPPVTRTAWRALRTARRLAARARSRT